MGPEIQVAADEWPLFVVLDRTLDGTTTSAFIAAEWAGRASELQTLHGFIEVPSVEIDLDVSADPPLYLLYELTSARLYLMPTSTPVEQLTIIEGDPYRSITGYFVATDKAILRELEPHIRDYEEFSFLIEDGAERPPPLPEQGDADSDGGGGGEIILPDIDEQPESDPGEAFEIDWSTAVEISDDGDGTPEAAWERLDALLEDDLPDEYQPTITQDGTGTKVTVTLDQDLLLEDGFEVPENDRSFLGELIDRGEAALGAVTGAVFGTATTIYEGVDPGGTQKQETVRRFGEGMVNEFANVEEDPDRTFDNIVGLVRDMIAENIPFIGELFKNNESAIYFQQSVATMNIEINNGDYVFDGHTETFVGLSGNQVIRLGSGDDLASGGLGEDRLFGEAGRDELYGGEGDDILVGGTGEDSIHGGEGDDVFAVLRGETEGVDTIFDFAEGDRLAFDDRLFALGGDGVAPRGLDIEDFRAVLQTGAVGYERDEDADRTTILFDDDGPGTGEGRVPLFTFEGAPDLTLSDVLLF